MNEASRLRVLRGRMASEEIEALLVTHLPDVRYLCGFTGSNAVLAITANKAVLFTDGRYTTQSRQETQAARVSISKKSALKDACMLLESAARHASYDPEHTTVSDLAAMRSAINAGKRRGFFSPLKKPVVSELRTVKDADELKRVTAAAALGNRIFNAT